MNEVHRTEVNSFDFKQYCNALNIATSIHQLRLPTKFIERLLSGPRVSSVAAVSRGSFSVPKYSVAYRGNRSVSLLLIFLSGKNHTAFNIEIIQQF